MTEKFANNASSTLNGAINNSQTSIVVTSATTFPSTGNFRLLLGANPLTAEITLVTGVSGNTFTVLRGQEGTTASSWPDLTTVTHILTAGAINQLAAVQNGGNYSSSFDYGTFSNITSTASTTFVNGASFEFDPTILTAANGTRTIGLRVIAETTGPQATIQLYNYTAASVVTGSTLTTSSVTPVLLTTGDLSSNLTNGPALYQVQIKMASGGGASDRVSLDMAKLRISWS